MQLNTVFSPQEERGHGVGNLMLQPTHGIHGANLTTEDIHILCHFYISKEMW